MAARAYYRLPDEPLPSGLSRYATDPLWPLLTLMLAGGGFGLAWFAFNSAALGSPTRGREWGCIALSALGSPALVFAVTAAVGFGALAPTLAPYALLSVLALKVAVAYALYLMQQHTFEVWEHYGGQPRNGLPLMLLLAVVGRGALDMAALPPLLRAVLQ
ncbi:hypothetical protein [Lysobacter enzymogenes]|uniref:Yip1 domain-containing protein n=1 Tax=Lysobacter enzymogenes TaxID=69 RepID=A0AAU9AFZ2_LYSEN|nr:hypothetical protein [Lysobacter enzymogenes]BAV97127.1 conserved hypothetical protein [Lysobacter enzymogenes]